MKQLTERDLQIVEVLTHRVPLLSIAQTAREWFGSTPRAPANAAARMRILQEKGFVEHFTLMASAELELRQPLARWRPGDPQPALERIVPMGVHRWAQPVPTPVITASAQAARSFGGNEPCLRLASITHDLHLAQIFLKQNVHLRRRWVPESTLMATARRGTRVPDALIRLGGTSVLVELVGDAYRPADLVKLHRYAASKGYRYEIW